ncbi:unnamed protein product [Paramecium pentaurelia]|uniref:Uncharacterized protein n=1 Tax=Paramecium pentaurelia TaxID=43138 RepID=A0A8S1VBN0_9CILI|nr:unnamed protein product [Paramecium pentaurelia]
MFKQPSQVFPQPSKYTIEIIFQSSFMIPRILKQIQQEDNGYEQKNIFIRFQIHQQILMNQYSFWDD